MMVPWLPGLSLAFVDDSISRYATLVVLGIAAILGVYAVADPELRSGRIRFAFVYALFVVSAIGFAHASGLFTSYVAWEAMSVCSFLLIAQRMTGEVVAASVRALTSTRFADMLLLIGAGMMFAGAREAGLSLVVMGAAIKSGQLGATPWLVGAMVAPTPVSALLHSATLVAAGPFLIARLAPDLASFPNVALLLAMYAGISALAAALFAASSSDAKRTLAWSTSEQLAQATLATAVGVPAAAYALLAGHALAKPLLFIAAGDLRAATGSTDFRSASRKARRVRAMLAAAVIGAIGIIGIPPFLSAAPLAAIWSALVAVQPSAIVAGLALAALTGWYVTRFVVRLFPDENRPFTLPARSLALHIAAWLAVVLLAGASFATFRWHVDLMSTLLPLAALSGAGFAFAARGSSAIISGPAIQDGVARWDRFFRAPVFAAGSGLDRADRRISSLTQRAATRLLTFSSALANIDQALDRGASTIGRSALQSGEAASRLVGGNVSRYIAYTAFALLAAEIVIAIVALTRARV